MKNIQSNGRGATLGMLCLVASLPLTGALSGCGSVYSGTVGSSGLGAAQYVPAVYVEPGNELKYQQVLQICRQAANNRQMTSAQEAQLKTLTGVVAGTAEGAATGLAFSQIFKTFEPSGEVDVSRTEGALVGATVGLVGSLASSFAKGAEATAAETRASLLACLRVTSKDGQLWQVLE